MSWIALAPVLLADTAPVKLLPALLSVIALAPAVMLEVPTTVKALACVTAPPVVSERLPETAEVPPLPKAKAFASFSVTLLPLTMRTAPAKSLPASLRVMLLAAPAVSDTPPAPAT